MSATAENNTTQDPYGPSDRAYAAVKKVSKLDNLKTGEKILFTPLMKSFYFHIWRFQNNGGHGWVWDNQDYIAWELGTTKPALGRAINSLAAAGVVEIKERDRGSLKSYAYQVVNPNRVVEMGFTPPAPSRTAGIFKAGEFKATDEARKNDGKSESGEQPAAVEPSTLGNDDQAQQQEHEQQSATDGPKTATPAAGVGKPLPDVHSDQHDDVPVDDAVNDSEQQNQPQIADLDDLTYWRDSGPSGFGFMAYGALHGETEVEKVIALIDQHYSEALNQIPIFDEKGVVTEAFINALSGDATPNRNTDGTLQSFRYVYWVARYSQDERDGIPVRTREEYMTEARPEYVPTHLLPSD